MKYIYNGSGVRICKSHSGSAAILVVVVWEFIAQSALGLDDKLSHFFRGWHLTAVKSVISIGLADLIVSSLR